jgi:hypothetical protein
MTPERKFKISLAGTLVLAVMIVFALAPRKARAHKGSFAKPGSRRFSLSVVGPSGTSQNHLSPSASHGIGSEYWPSGSMFEAPPNLPQEKWSPGPALARAVFGDIDSSEKEPFLLAAGLPGSRDGANFANGEWSTQQLGNTAGNGNTAGGGNTSGYSNSAFGAAGAGGAWVGGSGSGTAPGVAPS